MKVLPNKLIVLEGPRGVGKSTVCERAVIEMNKRSIPALYYKKGARLVMPNGLKAPNEFVNMMAHLHHFAQLELKGIIVVCDRFHLTEHLFSRYHGRETEDSIWQTHQAISIIFKKMGYSCIMLTASNDVLEKRIADRGTRDWDLPKEDTQLLWSTTFRRTLGATWTPNETPEQMASIIYSLVSYARPEESE